MTAMYDPHSIEARKARYSRELAAYTLRQWDLVRQAMETGDSKERDANPPLPTATARDRALHRGTPKGRRECGKVHTAGSIAGDHV